MPSAVDLSSPTVPSLRPPVDPGFVPPVLFNRRYRETVRASGASARLLIALERNNGQVSRNDLDLLPADPATDAETLRYVERHIKFLLWASGGWRLTLSGPPAICRAIQEAYSPSGARAFDIGMMETAYDRDFAVVLAEPDAVPAAKGVAASIGGHVDGCRIGFDLGASDYKLAAVVDGQPTFSTEIPWHPATEADPTYHYDHIMDGLKRAAAHLPRVDAIGGSAAGVYVDNRVKLASLFRSVPKDDFARRVAPMFLDIQEEWDVPLIVVNDGDVTALAGAMSLDTAAILGMAMGSSEAVGYLDRDGCITGALNELAFAPVDFNPHAAADEWSGDIGVGALYFSQQAVARLAPAAGISFADEVPLPERLRLVQERAEAGDRAAIDIFASIGIYLGYTVPHYADYYDFDSLLILGRVTSGRGGEIVIEKASAVMSEEFPELHERIALRVPDEKSRRVGQAVAAASLPRLAASESDRP